MSKMKMQLENGFTVVFTHLLQLNKNILGICSHIVPLQMEYFEFLSLQQSKLCCRLLDNRNKRDEEK